MVHLQRYAYPISIFIPEPSTTFEFWSIDNSLVKPSLRPLILTSILENTTELKTVQRIHWSKRYQQQRRRGWIDRDCVHFVSKNVPRVTSRRQSAFPREISTSDGDFRARRSSNFSENLRRNLGTPTHTERLGAACLPSALTPARTCLIISPRSFRN